MKRREGLASLLFVLLSSSTICSSTSFDFFYLVQQWPPALCETTQSCCLPTAGTPAKDFTIHGLWPDYNSGEYPDNCRQGDRIDPKQISDLLPRLRTEWPTLACPSADGMSFWGHEWQKHGTCSSLNQHAYFQAALDLRDKANLLTTLKTAGIIPGEFYGVNQIRKAIQQGLGYLPYVECNVDTQGNYQLYQVYLCVDTSASKFIACPVFPRGRGCGPRVLFQGFHSQTSALLPTAASI